jgi:hypothetical protein
MTTNITSPEQNLTVQIVNTTTSPINASSTFSLNVMTSTKKYKVKIQSLHITLSNITTSMFRLYASLNDVMPDNGDLCPNSIFNHSLSELSFTRDLFLNYNSQSDDGTLINPGGIHGSTTLQLWYSDSNNTLHKLMLNANSSAVCQLKFIEL